MKLPPLPTIIIDTREQRPYEFPDYPVERRCLPAGDYSLAGYESRVAIERKCLSDAYGVVGGGRERFLRELRLLAGYASPCIIIEASLDAFAKGHSRTRITPAQAVGSFISWAQEFRIPVWFAPDHAHGERIALRWLQSFWRHHYHDLLMERETWRQSC